MSTTEPLAFTCATLGLDEILAEVWAAWRQGESLVCTTGSSLMLSVREDTQDTRRSVYRVQCARCGSASPWFVHAEGEPRRCEIAGSMPPPSKP